MLKLTVQNVFADPPEQTEQMLVLVQDRTLVTIDRVRGHFTQIWDVTGTRKPAASLLHGLELGVAAATRWIAVELLKDQTSPVEYEEIEGVALVLRARDSYWRLQLAHGLARDDCGGVYQDSRQWNTVETRDMVPQRSVCATKEQALAVLIEHAAPWIAAALLLEVGE